MGVERLVKILNDHCPYLSFFLALAKALHASFLTQVKNVALSFTYTYR